MKKVYCRREKAFRLVAYLLIGLTVCSFTNFYQILPSMAVRDMEIGQGLDTTKTVTWMHPTQLPWNCLYYLRQNDNVVMWTSVGFHPFMGGWHRGFATIIERDETLSVQAAFEAISQEDAQVVYAFGVINQSGTVVLQARDWEDDSVLGEYEVAETDYHVHGGQTYFIADITDFYTENYHPKFVYHLRTADDTSLAQQELDGSFTFT